MPDVCVLGAAMTRFGVVAGGSVRGHAVAAAGAALDDAGVGAGDVDLVAFGNAAAGVLSGQEMVRGQAALRHTALAGKPIINVENACASSSTAVHVAWMAVRSGAADIAVALGAEQLSGYDRARIFAMFASAVDLHDDDEAMRALVEAHLLGLPVATPAADGSPLMDLYAAKARAYLERSEATVEDFARVAVKNRTHAAGNPNAQFRQPISVEQVLGSRTIADPLRLLMCAPVGDGGAALVLASADAARRFGSADRVTIRASALRSTGGAAAGPGTVARAASAAYDAAGVGPFDIDVAEVHDAAAPAELMLYEDLGFCPEGEGAKLLRTGDTALGGRLPVNPSGGLLSKGHPVGATGCGQLVELVDQLRGRAGGRQVDDARLALAQNGGGLIGGEEAACTVTILERVV